LASLGAPAVHAWAYVPRPVVAHSSAGKYCSFSLELVRPPCYSHIKAPSQGPGASVAPHPLDALYDSPGHAYWRVPIFGYPQPAIATPLRVVGP